MLIFFYGSDTYRLRDAIAKFVSASRTKNVFSIDCTDVDVAEQLERPLKYATFFDEQKLVIARNGACAEVADVVKRYALAKATDVTLIIVQDTSSKCYDKKALTSLSKIAERCEVFEPLSGAPLTKWIQGFCQERNTSIEPTASMALVQRTDGTTLVLANELEKLCAYTSGSPISLNAVHALVPTRYDQDEWELSNALASLDKRAAVTALWRRLQNGASEQMLLGSLASGIRNVSMVKDLQDRHQPTATIAKLSGLHPFVVSKTVRGAAKADRDALRRAHCGLAHLDRAAKDGRADAVDGLYAILLAL